MKPIALADLGAGLDAALTAAALQDSDGRPLHVSMSPPLLAACGRVTTSTAGLRLYRYDEELARWVPSAVPQATVDNTVDAGVWELRFTTAGISGYYALVQETGTGVVDYVFRPGRA